MPELPEVETVVRELRPRVVGRTIRSVTAGPHRLRRPWDADWEGSLAGARVGAIRRRGKWIVFDLADGRRLVVHLGMTGQLFVCGHAAPRAPHTHVVFALDRGQDELRFRDVRRFGSVTVCDDEAALQASFVEAGLGPEPFELDKEYWRGRLKGARRALKAVLLDQRVVAGVGNIYADESLYEAKLHPTRLACEVSPQEADLLRRMIVRVLNRAIEYRGSSIRDYVGGSGERGGYQNEFRVYGRTGEPCRRCRTPIERIRLAGRSTHYCPRCQLPPKRRRGRR